MHSEVKDADRFYYMQTCSRLDVGFIETDSVSILPPSGEPRITARANNPLTDFVFMESSKAFDWMVQYPLLLRPKTYGLQNAMVCWIRDLPKQRSLLENYPVTPRLSDCYR